MLLICAVTVIGALFDRKKPDRPGGVVVIVALIVAWFAGASLF